MSKNEILERYLNVIYLGNGAYGVKAAAERYFDKRDPMQLTIGESALLAGLIQSPEALNPGRRTPTGPRAGACAVLDAMVETDTITEDEATRRARGTAPDDGQEPRPAAATTSPRRSSKQLLDDDRAVAGDVAE